MKEEYDSLMKNRTWELTHLPEGKISLVANGYIGQSSHSKEKLRSITLTWSQKDSHKKNVLTILKHLILLLK